MQKLARDQIKPISCMVQAIGFPQCLQWVRTLYDHYTQCKATLTVAVRDHKTKELAETTKCWGYQREGEDGYGLQGG
jgi:hypothetical protein